MFHVLLCEVGPRVLRRLSRKYRGRLHSHDLEDVLMLAVERLWKNRERFDATRGSLHALFWRVAVNAARDLLRRRARRPETSVDPSRLALLPAPGVDADEPDPPFLKRSTQDHLVWWMLSRLPETYRRILVADAASAEGTMYTGWLAEELGIRPATVRAYRSRARARIRALRRKPK